MGVVLCVKLSSDSGTIRERFRTYCQWQRKCEKKPVINEVEGEVIVEAFLQLVYVPYTREGDPEGGSTVLITALGSWEKSVPPGRRTQIL
jgi:hypothetical protein